MVKILLLAAASALAATPPPVPTFGDAPTLSQADPLASVLAKPGDYQGREVLLEGQVAKVCQKKGCWLSLTDGKREIRLTFKDYKFFVPKGSVGKLVRAQGVVVQETLSVKTVRHYLKDEGKSRAEIMKVKEPVAAVTFVASGLTLL